MEYIKFAKDEMEVKQFELELKIEKLQKLIILNELTKFYTAYESFEELCRNVPTLRLDYGNKKRVADIRMLRCYWEIQTGKKAYPACDEIINDCKDIIPC